MLISLSRTAPRPRGFTLVETMLSAGIVATVLLSVVGLIPVALDVQHDATRINTEARIVQAFVGEIQLCDWDQIDTRFNAVAERTRYFDDQGTLLPATTSDFVYSARVYLLAGHGPTLSDVGLPGDAISMVPRAEHIRRIAVHITAVPGTFGEGLLDTPTDPRVSTYATDVVNLRKR